MLMQGAPAQLQAERTRAKATLRLLDRMASRASRGASRHSENCSVPTRVRHGEEPGQPSETGGPVFPGRKPIPVGEVESDNPCTRCSQLFGQRWPPLPTKSTMAQCPCLICKSSTSRPDNSARRNPRRTCSSAADTESSGY
jgi:hypothetical protein